MSPVPGKIAVELDKARHEPEAHRAEKLPSEPAPTDQTSLQFVSLDQMLVPSVIPENGAKRGYATILESLGSGLAAVDFDRDEFEDLIIAGGGDLEGKIITGKPLSCLRSIHGRFLDVSTSALGKTESIYSHGIAATDFDQDGFIDFLMTGYGGVHLFRNCGDGTFQDVTSISNLCASRWNASAAWGDINRDGSPDLYVTGYVNWSFENDPPCFAADGQTRDNCSPKLFEAVADSFFLSHGDGSYTDATATYGVRADGKALGVVIADLDLDGYSDVYVGNDVMMNFLYRNESGQRFSDHSISSGTGVSSRGTPDASMGVEVADFNLDGLPDLWAANFEMESFALYQNQGRLLFRHVSEITGVSAIGDQFVGWGSVFGDFDNDGDEDICVCNGNVVQHPAHSPWRQRMVLLENREAEYFHDVTQLASEDMMTPRHGRGLVLLDWNRDGLLDLAYSAIDSPVAVLENKSRSGGKWVRLNLIGVSSARHPIGATAILETSRHKHLRLQKGGGSYLSSSSSSLHFGIAEDEEVIRLVVRWPNGGMMTIERPKMNSTIVIVEGREAIDHVLLP
ncbi:MAG: CRTAC1 family protein [Planctomycetota bacterium]